MRMHQLLMASVVLLSLAIPSLSGGVLEFGRLPCPSSIPEVACFGYKGPPYVNWDTVVLPLHDTIEYIQAMLQKAVEVEHSTIPLYLTTMYSIVNQSSFEALTIRSVVMEGTESHT